MDFSAFQPIIDLEDSVGSARPLINPEQLEHFQVLLTQLQSQLSGDLERDRKTLEKLIREYQGKRPPTKTATSGTVSRVGSLRKSDLGSAYRELVASGEMEASVQMVNILTRKVVKSYSGIVSITVMTSPGKFSCPQDCHYCPNDPESARSYDRKGPVALRATQVDFDVVRQFRERALTLMSMGHEVTKIEALVIGGTWSYHPVNYQREFITGLYYAANTLMSPLPLRPMGSLGEERRINETTEARIIGLTLETRPDHICPLELERFLEYGVTRVQLGIQHLNDQILEKINRKCPTATTVRAIRLLKQNCFKIDGHFMPDLPGSSPAEDREMFEYLFSRENEDFQVDQMKVYPTMVARFTKILEWYQEGSYQPYAERVGPDGVKGSELFDLIVYITTHVPCWVRLNRVVRDIPSTVIEGQFKETSLYQRVLKYLSDHGLKGQDIRWREVKLDDFDPSEGRLIITNYRSSDGTEYFISWETPDGEHLFGFIRVRINDDPDDPCFPELKGAALIRELHVYGRLLHQDYQTGLTQLMAQDQSGKSVSSQHQGIGSRLLQEAERICQESGLTKLAVIAGTGVKEYYRRRGYHDEGNYLTKTLTRKLDYNRTVFPPHIYLFGLSLLSKCLFWFNNRK